MSTDDRAANRGVPQPPPRRLVAPQWGRRPETYLPSVKETSAGGICVRVSHGVPYVALIMRRNRYGEQEWCLPKGHIEMGESAVEAALREVEEETGVRGRPIQHLTTIDYWFTGPRTRIHKTVHHFLFEYVDGQITIEKDPDHEAEDAAWVRLTDALTQLAYPNERQVARIAHKLLYPEH